MFKFHGHRFEGSHIEWERLKNWSDEHREGVSIGFVFYGTPPTASEARRRIAADIQRDKDTGWLSLMSKELADRALYKAKNGGRNRVEVSKS